MTAVHEQPSSDLLGLDRYQENTRTLGVLLQLSDKFVEWNHHLNTLSNRMTTDLLGFSDLDPLIQQIIKDLKQLLHHVCSEKKKFRKECKNVRESIKSVSVLGPTTNPEPPATGDKPKSRKRKRDTKKNVQDEVLAKPPRDIVPACQAPQTICWLSTWNRIL